MNDLNELYDHLMSQADDFEKVKRFVHKLDSIIMVMIDRNDDFLEMIEDLLDIEELEKKRLR